MEKIDVCYLKSHILKKTEDLTRNKKPPKRIKTTDQASKHLPQTNSLI